MRLVKCPHLTVRVPSLSTRSPRTRRRRRRADAVDRVPKDSVEHVLRHSVTPNEIVTASQVSVGGRVGVALEQRIGRRDDVERRRVRRARLERVVHRGRDRVGETERLQPRISSIERIIDSMS